MNNKQKIKELQNYHFSVYAPTRDVTTDGRCVEIAGVTYPYRKKQFSLIWLSAYLKREDQEWYWNPKVSSRG